MNWNGSDSTKTALGTVLAAALSFIGGSYWRGRARKDVTKDAAGAALLATAEDVQRQLNELQGKMALLGQAVQPITAAYSALLVKSLTHFHTPEIDKLLAKVG